MLSNLDGLFSQRMSCISASYFCFDSLWFANGGCSPYDLFTILPSPFLLFDLMFRFLDLWFVLFGLGLGAIVQGQHADTTQKSVLCMHAIPDRVPNNIGKVFAGQPEPMT